MTRPSSRGGSSVLTAGQGGNESSLGCFVRVLWPLATVVVLPLASALILRHPAWTLAVPDLFFWGIVLGWVAARYLDVAKLGRRTRSGAPVTVARFALESAVILLGGAATWCVLQALQVGER